MIASPVTSGVSGAGAQARGHQEEGGQDQEVDHGDGDANYANTVVWLQYS